MNLEEVVKWGVEDPEGAILWRQVHMMSFSQIAKQAWIERKLSEKYFTGSRHGHEDLRLLCLRRHALLETFAWRIYMFGSEPSRLYPGRMGELRKRQRTDPKYWSYLDHSNMRHGTVGCEQLNNLYRKFKRPCGKPDCTHQGQKHADKWLKRVMRREWETEIFPRYKT